MGILRSRENPGIPLHTEIGLQLSQCTGHWRFQSPKNTKIGYFNYTTITLNPGQDLSKVQKNLNPDPGKSLLGVGKCVNVVGPLS